MYIVLVVQVYYKYFVCTIGGFKRFNKLDVQLRGHRAYTSFCTGFGVQFTHSPGKGLVTKVTDLDPVFSRRSDPDPTETHPVRIPCRKDEKCMFLNFKCYQK